MVCAVVVVFCLEQLYVISSFYVSRLVFSLLWMVIRWELDHKKRLSTKQLMLSNCDAGEDSWESLGPKGDQTCQSYRK